MNPSIGPELHLYDFVMSPLFKPTNQISTAGTILAVVSSVFSWINVLLLL